MNLTRIARLVQEAERSPQPDLSAAARLAEVIRHNLGTGHWRPGDALPAARELAEVLPASEALVREAFALLARDGAVVSTPGRGMHVAPPRMSESELWQYRFLDGRGELLPVYNWVCALRRAGGEGPWQAFLGREAFYVHVARIVDVNHEFECLSEVFLPGPRFEELLHVPLAELDGRNIRGILRTRFFLPTIRVAVSVGCEELPEQACRALFLPAGTTGLSVELCGYGSKDKPLYYQRLHVPPNGRRLEIRERRP